LKPPTFYGRPLANNGVYWALRLDKNATVVCWADGKSWTARINGSYADVAIVFARGRTRSEALRKLERKTLRTVREFVRVFAPVFAQVGSELLRVVHNQNFHKTKKK
jgi:hypothetical protein